ncbi:uncharacterized protein LOC135223786 isoform X1 [Macrobrachium nipponense]|uniref:uncharacterized protein LOC135223786 isoform X1 n=1 Tax=Macrobrachium nipponense TaxID=159736 RepID=UPI0030C889C7
MFSSSFIMSIDKTSLAEHFMTNSVPTQSALHMKSYRIVSINGEPTKALYYQNDLIALGSEDQLIPKLDTVAFPMESSVPLQPGTCNVPAYACETVHELDSLGAVSQDIVYPYSVSSLGQGQHTFSVTTATLSLEGISGHTEPMEKLWTSLSVNKTHNSAENGLLEDTQTLSFPRERDNSWFSGIFTGSELHLNGQQNACIGHQVSGNDIPPEQVQSLYAYDNQPYYSKASLQSYGHQVHQNPGMSTESKATQTETGVLDTQMDALDLTTDNRYPISYVCCCTPHQYMSARDPTAEPSPKRLHVDYPYSNGHDKISCDQESARAGGTEACSVAIAPPPDVAAGWDTSSSSNNDSGCYVEGSAQSPNHSNSREVVDVLEAILQERVLAEVKLYFDSVRQMLINTDHQPARCADLEEEVFHSRYLLKMHQLAAKITHLIERRAQSQ